MPANVRENLAVRAARSIRILDLPVAVVGCQRVQDVSPRLLYQRLQPVQSIELGHRALVRRANPVVGPTDILSDEHAQPKDGDADGNEDRREVVSGAEKGEFLSALAGHGHVVRSGMPSAITLATCRERPDGERTQCRNRRDAVQHVGRGSVRPDRAASLATGLLK